MPRRPVPFPGSDEERLTNFHSHKWSTFGDEVFCWDCEAKPWHAAAHYRCGAEIPTEEIPQTTPADAFPGMADWLA